MVLTIGVVCFGVLVGFITCRTLIRATASASISDLATVVGAVGGGAVTVIAEPGTDLFGWYAIALLAGFVGYGALYALTRGAGNFAVVMAQQTVVAGGAATPSPFGPQAR
ncbi:hypothetical protein ABZU32_17685 [Sphaerisporangium sp. NPDC005288]|uniref:hypothetical protein n=1 Tax=Sphaerisporangium sp. NPDC005288 TaxID=3155114 RepID=UPI0033A1BDEE